MKKKLFNCVLGKDYHIINNNVDNMTYYLQDGNDVVLVTNLMNRLVEENEQLKKENQRVYGIIEDGGVLLTRKQLLDVIGEDKCDMFFREQETSNKLQEIKADAKTALLIIKAMQPLPFKISINEAKSLKRLSENVGELLDTEGD
ncbi:hypothetical protein [Methanobrevibacter sp.]|uniref:hypothetical protein n=1 Tax=Methanobrevibacter sp. TaxID=66852 RepID=UPI003868778F